MRGLIVGLVVMLGCGDLFAETVYDAAKDLTKISIDNAANPNGVWSYGYRDKIKSTEFTLLPVHGQFSDPYFLPEFTGLKGWFDSEDGRYGLLPVVLKNTTDTPLAKKGIIVPPGGLMLHPCTTPSDSYAVLRWTAPRSAIVGVTATVTGIDNWTSEYHTTTDVHVVKNGISLFDAEVAGMSPAPTSVQSYLAPSIEVASGDIIDFVVGPGADAHFGFDSTGVSVQVVVPEPSTVASGNRNKRLCPFHARRSQRRFLHNLRYRKHRMHR